MLDFTRVGTIKGINKMNWSSSTPSTSDGYWITATALAALFGTSDIGKLADKFHQEFACLEGATDFILVRKAYRMRLRSFVKKMQSIGLLGQF